MYRYTAYGLAIRSELALPELTPADYTAESAVEVRITDLNVQISTDGKHANSFLMKTPAGKFVISAGREILIEPEPDADEGLIRLFLLGPALSVLLRLRGLLVLHGSSVAVHNHIIVFLGDTGWGKSTLAEAFHRKGYPLVDDDIVAIHMHYDWPIVLPGFPQIKLWPDAAASLGHEPEQLPELYQSAQKRVHLVTAGHVQQSLPLRQIYILGPAGNQHESLPITPPQAFLEIVRFSRAMSLTGRPELQQLHFRQCTSLVNKIPVRRLKRLFSLDALPDLVDFIEKDLATRTDGAYA